MWFIGVEVEQETSAPPPKKILDPRLLSLFWVQRLSWTLEVSILFVDSDNL